MKELSKNASDLVTVNLRGEKLLKVQRSVLCSIEESSLEVLFSGRYEKIQIVDGGVYMETSPEIFELILEYLRLDEGILLVSNF